MKGKMLALGAGILLVSILILAGSAFHPSANAGPPEPTLGPDKTLLRFGSNTFREDLVILQTPSLSRIESSCGSPPGRRISFATADTEIRQGYPNVNYGNSDVMHCGYDDYYNPDGQIMRCLIRFDIPSLPADATFNGATLHAAMIGSYDFPGQTRTYTAYRIPSDWSESTVTWNNGPSPAEAYGSTGVTHGVVDWYSFNVTNFVQAWYNGTWPNYGIMLRGPEWSGYDSSWKAFGTKELGITPTLVVDYTYDWPTPPTLGASPTLVHFYAYDTSPTPDPQAVTISDITVGSLDWSAAKVGGASWLELDNTSGTVTPSSPDAINVSVNTSTLTHGTYTERIAIAKTSDSTNCSNRFVDVILEYGPSEPRNIFLPTIGRNSAAISENSDETLLTRDAVALVVGVAEYPYLASSTGVRAGTIGDEVQYTDDDARDIRDKLQQAGFSSGNVMTLINTDATKAAINDGFNWLDARENEGTLVFVSFSGHGGQISDVAPFDEADGKDEFIAPTDTTLALDNIILDDELDEWFSRLESKHVVAVVDSCHSGGMLDPTGVAASRGISFILNTQGAIAQVAEADGLAADISTDGRVVLVASRADQGSMEFGALENGVFSYFFVEAFSCPALADGNGDGWISAEEAFSYLECRVDNYVYAEAGDVPGGPYHQNPQLYDGTIGEEWIAQP